MQLSLLVPVLALLATPALSAGAPYPQGHNPHRRHLSKVADHARSVERLATAVQRREASVGAAAAAGGLVEKKKRRVNRRGVTCRAKTSSDSAPAATASSTTAASAETTAASTLAETSVASDAATSPATTQAATTSVEATAISSSAAAATTTAATNGTSSNGQYTPNGIKAGIAGGDAYDVVKDHIGWWYDWSADPSGHSGTPIAVPMLWGAGTVDSTDASRLSVFKALTSTPQYIMGFEEPDCSTEGSANIDVSTAVGLWDSLIGPWKAKGSTLISPSMCHQAAEKYINWLGAFNQQISVPWDITNLHINKNSMDGVKEDIDYYWNTFGKPIWVTEFACVDDSSSFIPCTDQTEINDYINQIVDLFESDERVHAYGYSNGLGLGDVWPMYTNGALTASGQTYLSAISKYH
ncbi:hypothetical protein I317_03518 [Kwoniella heveanensis CBS 569]|uniref:Asl1-like glycosyl hydrolase catalytic domain-containing protein n=1 Tax=Kwoniella heveanensis BCC8398 TaxID=1296120 RepID=A0A1B9GTX8_9TREE|nr:hypothetical protein I316_03942 [Kwoniella heveanensis BCC8398]OCF42659.1 hypothetical protein I317_03518 [Kwoniella heveanensis CBS 569]